MKGIEWILKRYNVIFIIIIIINSLHMRDMAVISKCAILQHILMINILHLSNEIALKWIPQDLTDDKSTLVQVMAWHHQGVDSVNDSEKTYYHKISQSFWGMKSMVRVYHLVWNFVDVAAALLSRHLVIQTF